MSGVIPTLATPAVFKNVSGDIVVADDAAAASSITIGQNGVGPTLKVQSGSLTSAGTLLVGIQNYRSGQFEQTGGTVSVGAATIGQKTNADASLAVSDGTFSSTGNIIIGSAATGAYIQSGGTVNGGTSMFVGNVLNGIGTATITGGELNITDNLEMDSAAIGSFYMNGGTVNIGGDWLLGENLGGTFAGSISGATVNVAGKFTRRTAGTTFSFSSGTLSVYDMAYNGDLEVGDGTSSATLILKENADEHIVNTDVLAVNSNSSLYGAGVLTAGAAGKRVGVKAGGTISAGEGSGQVGTFTIGENQALVLGDGSVLEVEADASSADLIAVSGTLSFVSNSTVTVTLTDLGGADFSQDHVLLTYGSVIYPDQVNWNVDTSAIGGGNLWVMHDSVNQELILTSDEPPVASVSIEEFGRGQDVINWTPVDDYGRFDYSVYYTTDLLDGFTLLTNMDLSVTSFTNVIDAPTVFYKITAE